jgi:3-hydroxybutyryl-CoA dehydratase
MNGASDDSAGLPLDGRLAPGSIFEGALTVTETHLVLGAGLIGGFQPIHIDEQFAVSAGLRGRVLHGALTAAIMSAVIGRHLPPTGWMVVEQTTRYRAPVYIGDTLRTRWIVDAPESRSGERFLFPVQGECRNQAQDLVAEGTVKLLLRKG